MFVLSVSRRLAGESLPFLFLWSAPARSTVDRSTWRALVDRSIWIDPPLDAPDSKAVFELFLDNVIYRVFQKKVAHNTFWNILTLGLYLAARRSAASRVAAQQIPCKSFVNDITKCR